MGFIFKVPPPIVGVGYIAGGFYPTEYASIDALDFATQTLALSAATLAVARDSGSSFNSSTKGYAFGGTTNTGSAQTPTGAVGGVIFSTGTAFTLSDFPTGHKGHAGVNSTTAGYSGGGISSGFPGPTTNDIRRLLFSTDVASDIVANLATSRHNLVGWCSTTRGYFAQGSDLNNTKLSEIDGITYASETAYNPAATVSNFVLFTTPTSVNSSTAGYISGGTSTVGKFIFQTESYGNASVSISSRTYLAGVNSTTSGYFCGGNPNNIDSITFATDTYVDIAAALTGARRSSFGFQSGGAL